MAECLADRLDAGWAVPTAAKKVAQMVEKLAGNLAGSRAEQMVFRLAVKLVC
mgnify:CR=1 FL=1